MAETLFNGHTWDPQIQCTNAVNQLMKLIGDDEYYDWYDCEFPAGHKCFEQLRDACLAEHDRLNPDNCTCTPINPMPCLTCQYWAARQPLEEIY